MRCLQLWVSILHWPYFYHYSIRIEVHLSCVWRFWFAPHDHKVGSSSIMEEISMRPNQFRVKLADFQQTATCTKHPGGELLYKCWPTSFLRYHLIFERKERHLQIFIYFCLRSDQGETWFWCTKARKKIVQRTSDTCKEDGKQPSDFRIYLIRVEENFKDLQDPSMHQLLSHFSSPDRLDHMN